MSEATAQWVARGGAAAVVGQTTKVVEEAVENARAFATVVYDKAPGAYIENALEQLRVIAQQVEWAQRVLVDEAIATKTVTQRRLAQVSGLAYTTVQRSARGPLLVDGSTSGPGTLPDARKKNGRRYASEVR